MESANLLLDGAGHTNQVWDADVLVIDKERMAEIAFVVPECLTMIPKYDEDCLVLEVAVTQPAEEFSAEDWWWFYAAEVGAPKRSAAGL